MTLPSWQLLVVLGQQSSSIEWAFKSTLKSRSHAYGYVWADGDVLSFSILGSGESARRLVVALVPTRPYSDQFTRTVLESATALFCWRENSPRAKEYLELVKGAAARTVPLHLSPGETPQPALRDLIDELLTPPWCPLTEQPSDFPYWSNLSEFVGCVGNGVDGGPISVSIPHREDGREVSLRLAARFARWLDRRRERRVLRDSKNRPAESGETRECEGPTSK